MMSNTQNETISIATGMGTVMLLVLTGFFIFSDGYTTNVYTELISGVATVVVIDRMNRQRNRNQLKQRLFNELKSSVKGQGASSLDWIRREGWLSDDPLVGAELYRINWENAYIGDLNLSDTDLSWSNLQRTTNKATKAKASSLNLKRSNLENANLAFAVMIGASFHKAKLHNADLTRSVLTYADLSDSDLTNARLEGADLQRVHFTNAKLFKTNLRGADIRHADFSAAIFTDKGTYALILPDGMIWSLTTDMDVYTNPNHPQFMAKLKEINLIRKEFGLQQLR
ncbi:MAG: pentapeptide repeat-containing protein [Chloroflexota bacterium]